MNRNLILAGLGALVAAATLHLGAPSAAAAPAFCAKHSPTHYITACAQAGGGGGPKLPLCPAEPCEQPEGTEAASSPLRDALRKALTGGTPAPSASTGSDAGGGASD
ncbi:membrane protein [Mycobacterium phage Hammy]|nr:membrane protein [Mycobacterium phage Hammy]